MGCFYIVVFTPYPSLMSKDEWSLCVISIAMILSALIITLTEFNKVGIAQGQSNTTSSLTPQQKAAMCDPSNPKLNFVNSTESKLCGIPKTVKSNMSNTTTTGPTTPSVSPTLPAPGS